jgi:hypothetical protein
MLQAAERINEDNAKAVPVHIIGANGAKFINGLYEPTEERGIDGRVVYKKLNTMFGHSPMCIEHFEGYWQIKRMHEKRSPRCFAKVEGSCELGSIGDWPRWDWSQDSYGSSCGSDQLVLLTKEEVSAGRRIAHESNSPPKHFFLLTLYYFLRRVLDLSTRLRLLLQTTTRLLCLFTSLAPPAVIPKPSTDYLIHLMRRD